MKFICLLSEKMLWMFIKNGEIAKTIASLVFCPSGLPSPVAQVKASVLAFHFVPLGRSRTHYVSSHLALMPYKNEKRHHKGVFFVLSE